VIGGQAGPRHIQATSALIKLVFLDTNILLYAAQNDLTQIGKKEVAIKIIRTEDYSTSGQVLAEFYTNLTRKGSNPLRPEMALEWVRQLARKPCQAIDSALVEQAIEISTRYQISYWDGAIIAAANRLGATILYTEDLNHNQSYGLVTAINPFYPT
jgi:predicted nucleic acid-binding protein